MYFTNKTIVFANGEFVKAKDATVSMFSQTLHYGNGVFEGIRAYSTPGGTKIFKAREHYQRLKDSAAKMHIRCNYSVKELIDITYEVLKRNKFSDAYIRPVLYSGINMKLVPSEESMLFIAAWKWARYLGNKLLHVTISSYERPNPNSCHVEAKVTGHYVNSILATQEAREKGFDEALQLDLNGNVAEGPGTNFFYEKDSVLYTAPLGSILAGITRATVMEIARHVGMEVREKLFTVEELLEGDSAFFTGTAAEVAGIGSVDGYQFPLPWEDSMGYILAQKYRQLIRTGDYSHSTTII
ncbi:MAG TPA: branched-chain amino acid transaminase [Chitinophagales bacterium]|nr:branched-chain amino acid transaminase [Chitinophagales bacterium]